MTCPAPNFWPRSRLSRTTADSSFCAGTVPSQDSGGVMHVSQLPQGPDSWPKYARSRTHAALHGLAQREHGLQVRGEAAPVGVVTVGGVDHLALLDDILEPVGQPGGGGLAVTAGAAGLLVVALDGLGQVEVGDEAHVGLVDAHAEGDGGDDDQTVLAQEA